MYFKQVPRSIIKDNTYCVLAAAITLKWTKVEFLKCNIKTSEISYDSFHLNLAGVQKIFKSIRKYYHKHNITALLNSFALRQIQRFYSILWLCDFKFLSAKNEPFQTNYFCFST